MFRNTVICSEKLFKWKERGEKNSCENNVKCHILSSQHLMVYLRVETLAEKVRSKSPAHLQYRGMFASFTPLHFVQT